MTASDVATITVRTEASKIEISDVKFEAVSLTESSQYAQAVRR